MGRIMYKSFIIGCGRIAGYSDDGAMNDFTHGYAYWEDQKDELAGCMDIDSNKGKLFAKKFNCTAFEDYKEGIDSTRSEIVSVCTPDDTHFQIVKALIEMDSNIQVIFLEKPACSTMEEMEELINLSTERNIDIVVNHTRRFDARYLEIKENIANGVYGDLVNGFATYYSGWQHNGVHVIDTLSFLFDDSLVIESVSNGCNSPYLDDPTIDGKLNFLESPGVIHLFSFDESYYQLFEFDLRFEKARLRIEDFGSRILLELKEVNNIGENVLVPQENTFENCGKTAIQSAVASINYSLEKNNPDLLNGYCLKDVASTMRTIWKGMELYEN